MDRKMPFSDGTGYDPFNVSPVDHSAMPAETENLDGPWGDRSPAANRNDVDNQLRTNLPFRYVEGAGEAAEKPRAPKIKG